VREGIGLVAGAGYRFFCRKTPDGFRCSRDGRRRLDSLFLRGDGLRRWSRWCRYGGCPVCRRLT